MFSNNNFKFGGIVIGALVILFLVMGVASLTFIVKSCKADDYSAKLDTIRVYAGEIKFVQLTPEEINDLNSDSTAYIPMQEYMQKIEGFKNQILKAQQDIEKRQEELVLDLRQETNNVLDKESAWLAFWITVLTIVGVICPLGYQILNFQTEKENIAKLEESSEKLKKKNEELLEAFKIKFNVLSFTTLTEIKIEETEGGDLRNLLKKSIKRHYEQFVSGISEFSGDWPELQEHVCSVLINIYGFLDKIKVRSTLEQTRDIRDLKDLILHALKNIEEKTNIEDLKKDLYKIQQRLSNL